MGMAIKKGDSPLFHTSLLARKNGALLKKGTVPFFESADQ